MLAEEGFYISVVLVYPPFHFRIPTFLQPPLVIAHLYSMLERAGVERIEAVDLDIEFNHCGENIDYFLLRAIERIERMQPKVICLTSQSAQFPFAVLLSRNYKQLHPEVKVVMGGWMPTLVPELALQLSGCDAVVRGEGERALPELLKKIDDDKWSIEGVSYMLHGEEPKVVHNPNSEVLSQKEMDELPLPRYDVLPSLTEYQPGYRNFTFSVEASRGCKYRCIFCWNSTKYCNTRCRPKSPKRTVQEIRHLVDIYGANRIIFADDCFGMEPTWTSQFASSMKNEFVWEDLVYIASMRVDTINDTLIEKLYESGLQKIFHGVESGSPRMLKILGKSYTPEITRQYIIDLVRKEVETGIVPECSFMVGLPDEREKDLDDTISLCRQLLGLGAHLSARALAPYEGTVLSEIYRNLLEFRDVYKEFGTSEAFDPEFRTVFGRQIEDFSSYMPDYRFIRPSMPFELFRYKYSIISDIVNSTAPPFFGEAI